MQCYITPVMMRTHVPPLHHQWPNSTLNPQKCNQCFPGSAGEREKDSEKNRDGKEYFLLFCPTTTPPALLPP